MLEEEGGDRSGHADPGTVAGRGQQGRPQDKPHVDLKSAFHVPLSIKLLEAPLNVAGVCALELVEPLFAFGLNNLLDDGTGVFVHPLLGFW